MSVKHSINGGLRDHAPDRWTARASCVIIAGIMIRKSTVLTAFFPSAASHTPTLVGAIRLAAELGYETVEFYHEGDLGRIRRTLIETGLKSVFSVAGSMNRRGIDMGAILPEDMDLIRQWVDNARIVGSERLMILSGPEHADSEEREMALAATAATAAHVCSICRQGAPQLGVTLEFFNNTGEPSRLLGPTERSVTLAETVRAECANFELTCDLSHLIQMGEDPVASTVATAPISRHLHLANCVVADRDNPLYGDKHPPFGHEAGEVDQEMLTRYLADVKSGGYFEGETVTLTTEVITRQGQDGETLLREATDVMRGALADAGL